MQFNLIDEDDLKNQLIDQERMDKALSSPSYTLPSGLSVEEIIEHITKVGRYNK